jgi:hypothetical protein
MKNTLLPVPLQSKTIKSQLHRVYRTAQTLSSHLLSTVCRPRRALHLNAVLRRLVSHRPMAGVVDVVVVVVDALAHAVHDDGAVDDLGDGADAV